MFPRACEFLQFVFKEKNTFPICYEVLKYLGERKNSGCLKTEARRFETGPSGLLYDLFQTSYNSSKYRQFFIRINDCGVKLTRREQFIPARIVL